MGACMQYGRGRGPQPHQRQHDNSSFEQGGAMRFPSPQPGLGGMPLPPSMAMMPDAMMGQMMPGPVMPMGAIMPMPGVCGGSRVRSLDYACVCTCVLSVMHSEALSQYECRNEVVDEGDMLLLIHSNATDPSHAQLSTLFDTALCCAAF